MVLDLGCGPGNYSCALAERFPKSTFIGLDYSSKAVQIATGIQKEKGLKNVSFVEGDAHNLPTKWTEYFDMVFVYDVLHDIPDPLTCLEQIHKVMKVDGCFSLVDMGFHSDPLDNAGDMKASMFYTISTYICLASSLTEEPHIGYGAMWGVEEIEKVLLSKNFKILGKGGSLSLIGKKVFFFCAKI